MERRGTEEGWREGTRGQEWREKARTRVLGAHGSSGLGGQVVELLSSHARVNAHNNLLCNNNWVNALNRRLLDD